VMLATRRRFPLRRGAAAGVVALAVIYSVYLSAHAAPRFLLGMRDLLLYSESGHDAYLLGEVRHTGWWYYFPLVLAIKTPIPVLALAAAGAWAAIAKRRHGEVVLIAAAMLAAAMLSRANLGVRHAMPFYVPLSALAALGMLALWETRVRWIAPLLAAWLVADSALAHPYYLPWMNAFAGPHPERVVVDSNLDWGQDVLRLRTVCQKKHIAEIAVALFGTADLRRLGLPPTRAIDPQHASPGWYAISESIVMPAQARDPRAYAWLTEGRTFERVGRSIRLYRVES